MKKVIMGIVAALMMASCVSPSDYCDKVAHNVDVSTSALKNMTQAISQRNKENSDEMKANLRSTYETSYKEIQAAWKTIHGMSDFRGDDELRAAADEYVGFYASYFENQLSGVVSILTKDSTTYDDTAELMEYIYELNGKETEYKNKYHNSLIKFMKKNELAAGL